MTQLGTRNRHSGFTFELIFSLCSLRLCGELQIDPAGFNPQLATRNS
jgi:hypothetical protein